MRARLGLESQKVVDIEPGTRESEGVQEAHVDAERRFPPPVPDVVDSDFNVTQQESPTLSHWPGNNQK